MNEPLAFIPSRQTNCVVVTLGKMNGKVIGIATQVALLKEGETLYFTVLRAGKLVELSAPVSR